MSKSTKPIVISTLYRATILKLRDFRPKMIPGLHLTHFSTIPGKKDTSKGLAVYQQGNYGH